MGTHTTYFNLFKPATTDPVDVAADIGANMDLIDAALHAQSGATDLAAYEGAVGITATGETTSIINLDADAVVTVGATGDGGTTSIQGAASVLVGSGTSGVMIDGAAGTVMILADGAPVLMLGTAPEIPATPDAQDIADILVGLGLATQAS